MDYIAKVWGLVVVVVDELNRLKEKIAKKIFPNLLNKCNLTKMFSSKSISLAAFVNY